MARIISIHSFRRGAGKSLVAANVAALMADESQRVGVIDANLLSPSLHIFFHLDDETIRHSLNDYLFGKCGIEQAAYDVTANLETKIAGQVFLVPADTNAGEIARVFRQGYDESLLADGFLKLAEALKLDAIVVDNYAGLSEEIFFLIAMSDSLVVIVRPDKQDIHGTGVMIEAAHKLGVPHIALVVNEVPLGVRYDEVWKQVRQAYGCEAAAVIPHIEDIMAFGSAGVFTLHDPRHPITPVLKQLAVTLASPPTRQAQA